MTTVIVSLFIPLISLLLIFIIPLVPLSRRQRTPQQKTQAEQKVAGLQSQAEQPVTKKPTPTTTTPKPRAQAKKSVFDARAQVKKSVFDEWKDMRARRVPEGTKVRWRLKVWVVHTNRYVAELEGYPDYKVECPRGLLIGEGEPDERVLKTMAPAAGDWVEIQGRFDGVTSSGRVRLDPDDFTNLGPGY